MPQTGPLTPDGKARSSQNAIKHGLYSASLVVADETLAGWQAFLDAFVDSFHPGTGAETELACRAASILWRLRRVPIAEANLAARDAAREALNAERRARFRKDGKDPEFPETYYASVLPSADPGEPPPLPIPDAGHLEVLSRYENRLHRQLDRTLRQLTVLQSFRRRDRPPLPAAEGEYPTKKKE